MLARTRDRPSSTRALQTVTRDKTLITTEKVWTTEASSTIGKGTLKPADRLLDLAEHKDRVVREGYVNLVAGRAKVKLHKIIDDHFDGNVEGFFGNIDKDNSGQIVRAEILCVGVGVGVGSVDTLNPGGLEGCSANGCRQVQSTEVCDSTVC